MRIPPLKESKSPERAPYDFHSHTVWSDGEDTIETMITTAKNYKLTHFAITDHYGSRSSKIDNSKINKLRQYLAEIRDVASKFRDSLSVFAGLEIDYFRLGIDLEEVEAARPDIILFEHGEYNLAHLQSIVEFADSVRIPVILAHPSLSFLEFPFRRVKEILEETRIIIELNVSADFDSPEIKELLDSGLKFSLGTDSHFSTKIGLLSPVYEYINRSGRNWKFFLTDKPLTTT